MFFIRSKILNKKEMKKKLRINFDIQSEYTLFGISTQLKDYRLAFHFNNDLKLELKRMEDLLITDENNKQENKFSFYYYFDEESQNTFSLISNNNKNGKLLPLVKQIDYFLIIKDFIKSEQKQQYLSLIRKIRNVHAALELDIKKIKNTDFMLSDMEIHITELILREKEKRKNPVQKNN